MRNLEILSKFSAQLPLSTGQTLVALCLDEFSHKLFAYTSDHIVYVFSYKSAANKDEHLTEFKLLKSESFADQDPLIESSKLVQFTYV